VSALSSYPSKESLRPSAPQSSSPFPQLVPAARARDGEADQLDPLPDPAFNGTGEVEVVQWDAKFHKQGVSEHVSLQGEPVVLLNSPASEWPVVKNGKSAEYWCSGLNGLPSARRLASPAFTAHHHSKPFHVSPDWEDVEIDSGPFVALLSPPSSPLLPLYNLSALSGDYHRFLLSQPGLTALPHLAKQMPLVHVFMLSHNLLDPDWDAAKHAVLTASGRQMALQASYSPYHRFVAQLTGYSRFTLCPPSEHASLYPFPQLHSHARSSQLDLSPLPLPRAVTHGATRRQVAHEEATSNDLEEAYRERREAGRYGRWGQARCSHTLLRPSELLYIPPFYFAHHQHLTFAVSVSVSSNSQEAHLVKTLLALGVPVSPLSSSSSPASFASPSALHLAHAINHVITTALAPSSSSSGWCVVGRWVDDVLLVPRYLPLAAQLHCPADPAAASASCPAPHALLASQTSSDLSSWQSSISAAFADYRSAAPEPTSPSQLQQAKASMDLMLGEYVEEVVNAVVGAENVCGFLSCLHHATAQLTC